VPSIILSIVSYQTNVFLLIIGLVFILLSVIIFFSQLLSYNKKRRVVESLKSYIIDNTENYKKSEYYVLSPNNYQDFMSIGNAPKLIKQNILNLDNLNEISIEKEKEYFLIKFLCLHPNLTFKEVKNYITKVYYELGRDS